STLLEANIALDDLNDVTITSPTAGQVLSYNGTAWVNDTNGITGTGTTNYVPKFTSSSAIGNSQIFDNGTNVGIGTATPSDKFSVEGFISTNGGAGTGGIMLRQSGSEITRIYATPSRSILTSTQQINLSINYGLNLTIFPTGNVGVKISDDTDSGDAFQVLGTVKFRTINNATTDTDKFIVSDGGVIKYRTGSEVLSDIGGAAASSISGTTNYIPKFTSSSAIGNSQIFDNGTSVGIATATPSAAYRLDIEGNVRVGSGQILAFSNFNNTNTYQVYNVGGSGAGGEILVFTNGTTERMRLDASGNLGIGTTSTAYKLEVNNAARVGNSSGGILLSGDGGSGNIWTDIASPLRLGANNAEYMRITSGGNVGIGTTSPQTQLDIANGLMFGTIDAFPSATYDAAAVIAKTGSLGSAPFNNAGSIVYRARVTSTAGRSSHIFYTGSPSTERMRLNESGNLGIGTATPQSILDITAPTPIMTISATTTTVLHGIEWKSGTSLDAFIKQQPNTGEFRISNGRSAVWGGIITFYTDISERMRLTSAGELLINTTTDAGDFKLQVSGNAYVSGSVGIGSTSTSNGLLTIAGTAPRAINMAATFTGGTSRFGILQNNTINSDVTSSAVNNYSQFATQAAAFTLTTASHYTIAGITIGAGSSVTNQIGYRATNITEATNNYGFYGEIASGTGRWNLYMVGTADNYLAGALGIGVTNPGSYNAGGNQLVIGGGAFRGLTIAGTTEGNIYFADGTTGTETYRGSVGYNHTSDYLFFYSAANERMRITSSGELLINTTTDAGDYKLQVNGNVLFGNTAGIKELRLRSTDNYAFANIWGGKTGDVAWLLMSGYPNNGDFTIRQDDVIDALIINKTTGNATFSGSIKTAAPSGGTAQAWKLGTVASVSPTSPNRTIEVEVNGTTYYLHAKTTND
ncbi:MAG: beta strand repeat-containing protein, partial [Dolichospermum sp.]